MEEVKIATTFEEIRAAGERFGKILGTESARALVMLVMAALGQTVHGFAARRIVFREQREATRHCRTVEDCRAALTRALRELAEDIATPGTELNQFVTRTKPE